MSDSINSSDALFHDIAGSGDEQPGSGRTGDLDLSVVLPFCNERDNLPELLDRLAKTLQSAQLSYELILVDDGSTDGGFEFLAERARSDSRIKILQLSRNFGQHVAATAGIDAARGNMIVWMDTDLQERPEDIPRFVAKHREGYDIVYACRRSRQQSWLRARISRLTMKLLNRFVGLDLSPDQAVMRLFSRQVADAIRQFGECNRYLGHLMPWAGFRSTKIAIDIDPRLRGETKYSAMRLAKHAVTGLTSFSAAPLRFSAACSGLAFVGCLAGIAYVLYGYVAHGYGVSGWASLAILVLVLQAMQFAVLAIIGEYVGLAYAETKRRPLYFCRRIINMTGQPEAGRTARARITVS